MTVRDTEAISPELVLVDPELAARVRATAVAGPTALSLLREPTDQGSSVQPNISREISAPEQVPSRVELLAPMPHDVLGPTPQAGHAPRRARSRRWVPTGQQVSTAALLLVVCGILGAAFLPPRQMPILGAAAAPPAVAPITLTWKRSGSGVYRVEILAGRRVVHRADTTDRHMRVPTRLGRGRYTWRVEAFVGRGAGGRATLRLIDHGWFLNDSAAR